MASSTKDNTKERGRRLGRSQVKQKEHVRLDDAYIHKQQLKIMNAHLANGIMSEGPIKHKHDNSRMKTFMRKGVLHILKNGYIFIWRKGTKARHLHYHAAYQHVVRQAPKFFQHLDTIGEKVSPEITRLCPQTMGVQLSWPSNGRATLIDQRDVEEVHATLGGII